jgi:hypothetical protein
MKSVPITAYQFSTAGGEEYLVHLFVLRIFCDLRQVSGFQENGLQNWVTQTPIKSLN